MRIALSCALVAPIVLAIAPPSHASDRSAGGRAGILSVDDTVEARARREYYHPREIKLAPGFWAKTGSDVTATTGVTLLQMSDEVRPADEPDRTDRSPAPSCFGDEGATKCISGDRHPDGSADVDIALNTKLPNPPSYYAINKIEINEGSNNPCYLRLWGNMVDPRFAREQDQRVLAEYRLGKCRDGFGVDHERVGWEASERRFIRALQVCIRHQVHFKDSLQPPNPIVPPVVPPSGPHGRLEIKGVRVQAGEVMAGNERVTTRNGSRRFIRPQCPDRKSPDAGTPIVGQGSRAGWHDWSTCPDGQLVSGLKVFYNKDKALSAMQVKCKPLRLLAGSAPARDRLGY